MQIKKKTLLWIVIVVLFLITLIVAFKAGSGNTAVSAAGQAVSTTSAASNAMVGGC